jgi:multiple sugar transport system permease protein
MVTVTRLPILWVAPWIVGFVLFVALPAGMSAWCSLTDASLLEAPVFVGLANYRELAGDAVFRRALANTAVYAAASVTLGTMVALALALLLHRPRRGAGVVRAIVFLPTLVPLVAAALGWTWMYAADAGPINAMLRGLGVPAPDWLGDGRWAMAALVLMSLWYAGGATVILIAALRGVPGPLLESASLDGAGAARRFRHVTLPAIAPALLFNAVTGIIWSLQVFAVPYVMTEGGPEHATYFYTMYVFDNAFGYGRMGYACALAWIQLLLILVVTVLFLRAARRFVWYRAA